MPIEPPTVFDTQRDRDQWARKVAIRPDDSSVSTAKLQDHAVTNAKLRTSAAASVIGRSESTQGSPHDIVAAVNDTFLARRSGALTFDAIADTDLPATIARDSEVTAAIAAFGAAQFATGTYVGAFTGTTSDPGPTIRYTISGKVVVLQIPPAFATSNTTAFTITGAPAAIHPASLQTMVGRLRDNGTSGFGTVAMGTDGTLTLGFGAGVGTFTNSGSKGVESNVVTYSLD